MVPTYPAMPVIGPPAKYTINSVIDSTSIRLKKITIEENAIHDANNNKISVKKNNFMCTSPFCRFKNLKKSTIHALFMFILVL